MVFTIFFFVGSDMRIQFLWVLFHGVAAVILVLHLVNTFPSCASIGMYHAIPDQIIFVVNAVLNYSSLMFFGLLISLKVL